MNNNSRYEHNQNPTEIKKGQMRWCEFPRDNQSLYGGKRPGIILSNDIANKASGSVLVCPCTTKPKKKLPVHVKLSSSNNTALLEEITVLPRECVHDVIRELTWQEARDVNTAVLIEFGII